MLVNVSAEEKGRERIFNSPQQVLVSIIFSFLLVFGLVFGINQGYAGLRERDKTELDRAEQQRELRQENLAVSATRTMKITKETERVGGSLYRYASLPFEIASVLLLVAIIGSVMLARTIKQEAATDDVDPEFLKTVPGDEL
jgi:NADH:ubiquinone oxidoreductase subunit 6 (subunit J)